jgi:hypothetical protein
MQVVVVEVVDLCKWNVQVVARWWTGGVNFCRSKWTSKHRWWCWWWYAIGPPYSLDGGNGGSGIVIIRYKFQ